MADSSDWRDCPHYVYEMYDEAGICLYVGCTSNISQRLAQHRTTKTWWDEIATLNVARHRNYISGSVAERSLIQALQPINNEVFTESRKPGGWETRRLNDRLRHERGEPCPSHKRCHICKAERAVKASA